MTSAFQLIDKAPEKKRGMGAVICTCSQPVASRENVLQIPGGISDTEEKSQVTSGQRHLLFRRYCNFAIPQPVKKGRYKRPFLI
jgi:hypothetical protein